MTRQDIQTKDAYYQTGYEHGKKDVLDKIQAEITEYKDDQIIHAERNEMIDIVLEIIGKYRNEVNYGHMD